jgi:hypothetical protein
MSPARPSRFAFLGYPAVALFLAVSGCTRSEPAKVDAKAVKAPASPRQSTAKTPAPIPARCTPAWNQEVDRRLGINDSAGHGPDIGSAEWMNAVSRKSGVFDAEGHGPDPGSDEWCRAVDYKVFGRR